MRTFAVHDADEAERKAKETMDIYAPIAISVLVYLRSRRNWMTWHLSIPAEVFYDPGNQINARKTEREEFVEQIVEEVSTI